MKGLIKMRELGDTILTKWCNSVIEERVAIYLANCDTLWRAGRITSKGHTISATYECSVLIY